nr:hypothetical protein [Acidipropionibacterium virtanenii]
MRASAAASGEAPAACSTIRTIRRWSFSLVATTSTIRFDQVLPSRTIAAVEMALRTIFWAVPDFIRVDPVTASGPVSGRIATSANPASGACGLVEMSTVARPRRRASASAPRT